MRESGHTHTGKSRKQLPPGNVPPVKRRLCFTALAVAVLLIFSLSACSRVPDGAAGAVKDTVGGLIDKVRGDGDETAEETPQPEQESDPNDHPEPPPEEKPQAQDTGESVDFAHRSSGNYESAVITGKSREGKTVWSYTTGQYEAAQLDRLNDVGVYGDTYYFVEDGTVTALRVADGEVLWKNGDFGGSVSAHAFDGDGNVYLCGYFGPDLFIVRPGGVTVKLIDSFDSGYYWPKRLDYQGTQLAITFEGTPSEKDETVYISLDDYSTSINKAGGAITSNAPSSSGGPRACERLYPGHRGGAEIRHGGQFYRDNYL